MSRRRYSYDRPTTNVMEVEKEPIYDKPTTNVMEVEKEPIAEQPVEKPRVVGYVDGCERLNIRREPNKDSAVITIIDKGLEVTINPDNSSTEWYSIKASGVEGFVMSKFIKSDDYMNLDGIERWKAF